MTISRRDFGRMLIAAPAAGLFVHPLAGVARAAGRRPNSRWAGVQVGLNVPYSFGTRTAMNAEQILGRCVALGVSTVELRGQAIEISLGLPEDLVLGPAPSDYTAVYETGSGLPEAPGNVMAANAPTRTRLSEAQIATYRVAAARLRAWRATVAMDRAAAIRAAYERAGVQIGVIKFDGISEMAPEEYDYIFRLAKALGARTVSGEFSMRAAEQMAAPAERHGVWAGLHNHLAVTPAIWEAAFAKGRYIGANVDIGHYFAGNGESPLPFIARYPERITHLHVKDKTRDNRNVAFGTGDTPVKAILQAIRDNRWSHIQATIEYEIPLPEGADRDAELRRAIAYCRRCLLNEV
ncbi:sugar phosphate isomerase/epimerase family protein [Sphingomonas flavalba]|uniref:sugar phosphate isomerase/epimerase family protein n=1 Tax=Sphingomonas flavalba TaxID=2559804 RepID=UPI0039E1A14B